MDLRNVINWEIPEGVVVKVMDSNGVVIWNKGNNEPDLPIPLANEIIYVTTDNAKLVNILGSGYYKSNVYYEDLQYGIIINDNKEIPVDGFRVRKNYIYMTNKQLKIILIGDSITSIGSSAFYDCSFLTSISIPDSVTNIDSYAFYNCSSLISIDLPNNLVSLGYESFRNCSSLKSLKIPESIEVLNMENLCYGCTSLESLIIPENVYSEKISNNDYKKLFMAYCCRDCSSLTSIVIPDGIDYLSIGGCFYNCTSLNSVILPNSIETIYGENSFYNCSSLESIQLPNKLTYLTRYLFYKCTGLKHITIPDSVAYIEDSVFELCTSLENVIIGSSVTYIEEDTFKDCTSLHSITCKAMQSPELYSNVFLNVGSEVPENQQKILYVPQNSTGYETWLSRLKGFELQYITE